jgi:hypothetical protein
MPARPPGLLDIAPPVSHRVLIHALLLVMALLAPSATALAASDIHLARAADGTLLVVGSGWRRGQELVVSLGRQRFNVRADATGDFELPTGLATYSGKLQVHHTHASDLAFAPLPTPRTTVSLAQYLARSVTEGLALLGAGLCAGLVTVGIARRRRASRYPRR